MANKNKNKGKAWERDVCKIFGDVFELNFERVPNSGAFIGGKNAFRIKNLSSEQTLLTKGDIIPPSELTELIIECKSYKDFGFHRLLSQNKPLEKWIDQVEVDYKACDEKGLWLLIIKVSNRGSYICYNNNFRKLLHRTNFLCYRYNNVGYIFEQFNREWIENNKEYLLKVCATEQ